MFDDVILKTVAKLKKNVKTYFKTFNIYVLSHKNTFGRKSTGNSDSAAESSRFCAGCGTIYPWRPNTRLSQQENAPENGLLGTFRNSTSCWVNLLAPADITDLHIEFLATYSSLSYTSPKPFRQFLPPVPEKNPWDKGVANLCGPHVVLDSPQNRAKTPKEAHTGPNKGKPPLLLHTHFVHHWTPDGRDVAVYVGSPTSTTLHNKYSFSRIYSTTVAFYICSLCIYAFKLISVFIF